EFLVTRVSPERQQSVARYRSSDRHRSADHGGFDGGVERTLAGAGALSGMTLHQMPQLMAQRRSKLGLIVKRGKQTAGNENVVVHRMGIGIRRIEHDETIGPGQARVGDQLLSHAVDIGLQGGAGIGSTDLALDLARQNRRPASSRPRKRGARGGAAGDPEQERDKRQYSAEKH